MMRVVLVTLCCLVTSQVSAQTAFVQGGYSRDIKRFSHEGETSVLDATAGGFSIGAGAFLAGRWSAGVEMDLGGPSSVVDTVSVVISGRPAEIRTEYTSRRRSVSALAGFHTSAARRLRVGCYAGLSFTAFRREIFSDAPAIVLQEPTVPTVVNERITGAIVGVDVAIHVTPNVAVVPALRAQGLSLSGDLSGFSVRPSLNGRVVF
ncbi:MAG: hypothetical protein ACREUZ_07160 [Burkholderiales bacterium]